MKQERSKTNIGESLSRFIKLFMEGLIFNILDLNIDKNSKLTDKTFHNKISIEKISSPLFSSINQYTSDVLSLIQKMLNQKTEKELSISQELKRIALHESALYIKKNFTIAKEFHSREDVLDESIKHVGLTNGLYLEFGVFKGNSINFIASKKQELFIDGFDSFEGLPEEWRSGYGKGKFKLTNLPKVENNVRLHKGWFSDSIPKYLKEIKNPSKYISFLHIDCDIYSSTQTIFNLLGDRIMKGTIIVFDEYFGYNNWQNHEYAAFQEFVLEKNIVYDYIAFNSNGTQASIIIK
tara:strand:- start:1847 stop:2728 length:882 start_codon:yes stop_codon:yes gene_type:complete